MKKKWIYVFVVFIAVLVLVSRPYYRLLNNTLNVSPIKTLLSWDSIRKINNQTNILILGIAGGAHEGPTLSDSMVVANYDFKTNKLTTLGIPRDIWSSTLEDRLNSAYAYGEAKQKGGGLKLAKAEVSAVIGVPIQYSVVINFQGFEDLIDYLGGIEVDVERGFVDRKYPIAGKENDTCGGKDPEFLCRYETLFFKEGLIHMDGNTALKFVRSRNAIGQEGSDFARGQRQQKVLIAVKDKSGRILRSFNTSKIEELYKQVDPIIARDITNQQAAILAKKILFGGNFMQKNYSLPRDFFVVPNVYDFEGKYVLTLQDEDRVFQYVNCIFSSENRTCD